MINFKKMTTVPGTAPTAPNAPESPSIILASHST